jgi:hypothetical protein
MKPLQRYQNLVPLLLLAAICLYTSIVILTGPVYYEGEY